MYHATYLECKMLLAYPLSHIWPPGERPVVLPVYTQGTSPDMMMDDEGSPYMPGAPGTDDLVKAIVGKAIVGNASVGKAVVEKAIARKKRDAEEAAEGHESKRLVTDEMNRTSWGGGWRGDRLRWPEEEIHMLPEMQEVD